MAKKAPSCELAPNSKTPEELIACKDKSFVQVGPVVPYHADMEQFKGKTSFELHFALDTFVMELPFFKSGKPSNDIREQSKKKIIFSTHGCFPHISKRLFVKSSKVESVDPVDNARELIESKIIDLRSEMITNPIDIKRLQIILNGSLLAFVNAGPIEICKSFFEKDNSNIPTASLEALAERLAEFTELLGEGVKKNAVLIEQQKLVEQKDLQVELEKAIIIFRETTTELIRKFHEKQ